MSNTTLTVLIDAVRETAHPLTGATPDYDPLMQLIGDARFALLGEAHMALMNSTGRVQKSRSGSSQRKALLP